jgi:tetratricopeptide (TPR) repeat protein
MGVVYLARQDGLDRPVALKMVRAADAPSLDALLRFRLEAEMAARIRHPHVVQVYEVGWHGEQPYLALEYLEGGTLAERLQGGPLAPREAATLLAELADAVQAAHGLGIIHRDLKPANVLFDAGGAAKVADFGLAKRLDQGPGLTASGLLVGTPAYMAPEQAEGRPDVGTAADVYALGAILYECLTGKPVVTAESSLEALLLVRNAAPEPPSRLRPGLPRDLEVICLKCLEKEPGRRYATAADLAADLHRYLTDQPISARPAGPAERVWRWGRRHPAAAALAAAVVLGSVACGVLGVVAWQQKARAEANLLLAQGEKARAEANLEQARRAVDQCFLLAKDDPLFQGDAHRDRRAKLFQAALPYFRAFQAQNGDEPGLVLARAENLNRVGYVEQEVGQLDHAGQSLREALDLLRGLADRFPAEPEYRLHLADAWGQLANVHRAAGRPREAEAAYRQSLQVRTALAEAEPGNRVYRVMLAGAWINLGAAHRDGHRPDEALSSFAAARKILEALRAQDPGNRLYRADLATTLSNEGVLLADTGQTAEALRRHEAARDLRLRLVADHPQEAAYQADLAQTLDTLGTLKADQRQAEAALADYEAARAIRAELVARVPTATAYQADLARSLHHVGKAQADLGKRPEAQASLAAARALLTRLTGDYPAVPAYRVELAKVLRALGDQEAAAGQAEGARSAFTQATDLLARLAAADPTVPRYREELGRAFNHLANWHALRGDWAEAERYLGEARAVQLKLVAEFPQEVDYAEDLGGTCCNRGLVDLARRRPAAALGWFDAALAALAPVRQRPAPSSRARLYLRNVAMNRAKALGEIGRHAEAVADWEAALKYNDQPKAAAVLQRGRSAAVIAAGLSQGYAWPLLWGRPH